MSDTTQTTAPEVLPEAAQAPVEDGGQPALVRNKYADKMNRQKKKWPKPLKIGLTVLIIAGLVGGAVFLVNKTKNASAQQGETQQTATAMRGMLETYVECSGMTAAKNKADLGKDLKGDVTEVLVESGALVHTGDVLFIVDPKDTRKDLDDAKSELTELGRQVDEAQSSLNTAQKNVGNLTIKAPFSGKMIPQVDDKGSSPSYKVGQDMSSGTVLGTLVDDSTMRLPLYFNYTYLDAVKVGASATVSIPVSMSSVTGKVESIEKVQKVSDDGAMLFRVIISLQNPGTLKKDMVATASVSTAQGELMPAESGKLEYVREEQITAKVSGEISSVGNLDYYRYSAGQTICQLKSDEVTNAVGTAQRALESAEKNRTDKLTRVDELEKLIRDSTVVSPLDGVVTSLTVSVGDKLEGNATPCTVADLSAIVVNANIPEIDVDKVQPGMPVSISSSYDDSGDMFMGTVTSISLQASQNQGGNSGGGGGGSSAVTFPAVIQIDDPEGKLRPDRNFNVKITTASNPDCILVPSSAVVNSEQGAAVFAKPAEGQTFENVLPTPEGSDVPEGFVLVPIETGIFDDTNTEVISGIDEGTEVFLAGPQDAWAQYGDSGTAVMVG